MSVIDISIIIAALFGFYYGSLQGFDNKITKGALASVVFLLTLFFLPVISNISQGIGSFLVATLLSGGSLILLTNYSAAKEVRQGLKVSMLNNNLGGVTVSLFFGIFILFMWDTILVNEIVNIDMDNDSYFIAMLNHSDNPMDFSGVKFVASERP